jgi:uncharacterized protein (DUF2267 family)
MDNDRFLATVERRLHTDRDRAQLAVAAVLESLAERLSRGEARDLVERLPVELSVWLLTDHREAFDVDEFLRRIAKRERVDIDTAERHARAVLSVLREAVDPAEVADLVSDLPEDFHPIVLNLAVMPYETFVEHVARGAGLGTTRAARATEAVLETVAERIPRGEVDDLEARLPIQLHEALRRGAAHADARSRAMPAEEFARRVAAREGASLRDATRHTRAVMATLRDAVGVEEFADVVVELPKDYDPLLRAP